MKPKYLICSFILYWLPLHSQNLLKQTTLQKSQPFLFIENKGQLADETGTVLKEIKYFGHHGGVNLYFKPGMISFVFTKVSEEQNISEGTGLPVTIAEVQNPASQPLKSTSTISTSRIDLLFLGADPKGEITPSDQQSYFENSYTTGNADHGITDIHTFKTLTYKGIYPHIDMVMNIIGAGFEYSFIVHPGGNVAEIKMLWPGAEKTEAMENGGIRYTNAFGDIEESAPKSFSEGKLVPGGFTKTGAVHGFKANNYDRTKDLIIDPDLSWASYFGGGGQQSGSRITADTKGNVYITGYTTCSSGIATSGAIQTSFSGTRTTYIAKFSSSCKLIWATYYGGGKQDAGTGIKTDASDNVYITGVTSSSTGLATTGAFQTSSGGNFDAYLAKFNSTGNLTWGTYFGGSGFESSLGISIDGSGNAFISGYSTSSSGIASSGAYQTSYGGNYDAFLSKFSNTGSLLWATYFGGSNSDYAYGVSTDTFGNVFILGGTLSTTGIATTGAYKTSNTGNYDVFVAKFNAAGSLNWATYYGGNDIDQGMCICTDLTGNAYITGITQSSKGIATAGTYQSGLRGVHNVFLAKFSNAGVLQWATYYGITADNGYGVATDTAGNVFITGTSITSNSLATCGAYQTSLVTFGIPDVFLAKFNGTGTRLWATYYGGAGIDWGNAVCTDLSGNIYVTGMTTSTSGISTSNGYQTALKGDTDVFLLKFSSLNNDAGIYAIPSPKGTFCPGLQNIKVQIKNYGSLILDSVRINLALKGVVQKTFEWKGALKPDSIASISIGNYLFSPGPVTLKVWTTLPNGVKDSFPCNDTLVINDSVYSPPVPLAGGNHSICLGNKIQIGAVALNGYTYSWSSKPSGFTSTVSNPTVTPLSSTTYYLSETVTASGCTNTDTSIITVNPLPNPNAGGSQTICAGNSISIGEANIAGDSYSWKSKPIGFSSTVSNPKITPTLTTIYYLTEKITATGCSSTDSASIMVNPSPLAYTGVNQSICAGASVALGTASLSGHSYQWTSKPVGFSSAIANPIAKPAFATTYYLKETINATGCTKTDSVTITVNPLPKPQAGINQTICKGNTVTIGYGGTAGDTYQWKRIPSGFNDATSL
jgi:hypothetical protein